MFYYSLFHLKVSSSIELDAFLAIAKPEHIDVYVEMGEILEKDVFEGKEYQTFGQFKFNENRCYFEFREDHGKFLVEHKKNLTKVTIDVKDTEYLQTLLSYFYGTGLSSIMHYNGFFPIHASAVSVDNELVLFCGRSGIGKSTLAAHLKGKGYHLFSDDKCVLFPFGEDGWVAKPGLKIMRLWQDALDSIVSKDFLSNPKEVILRKDKFQFEINAADLVSSDQKLRSIFILQRTNNEEALSKRELFGIEKLQRFRHQIFRERMIKGMGLEGKLWSFITKLLKDVSVYLVKRPSNFAIEEFADAMDEFIQNANS